MSAPKPIPEIDPAEAFLAHFSGHQIVIHMLEDNSKPPVHLHKGYDAEKAKLRKANDTGKSGVFFAVNLLDESRDKGRHRTKKMITHARAVFMDADDPVSEPIDNFPLVPSLIVNTSPGKYHYYWLLDEPTGELDEWNRVQCGLIAKYNGDNNAKDLTRYLRLPGYNHCKKDPYMVTFTGDGQTYSWDEILKAFPPKEPEINTFSGEPASDNPQSEEELEHIIETGSEGLHGAINKVLLGMKRDGMSKGRAFRYVRKLGEGCIGSIEDRRAEYFNDYELNRSWEAAPEESNSVKLPDYVEPTIDNREFPWPPGLYGDLCSDVYSMMKFQNRKIAFITATSMLSGVVGRLYNIEGNGLNTYMLAVMGTGRGKDDIGTIIKGTLNDVNIGGKNLITGEPFIGPGRFTGPKAVIKSLSRAMSQICVFSEAGLMLKSKAGDTQGLTRIMLGLYTNSAVGKYSSKEEFSDDDNSIPSLHAPAFSVASESTEIMLMDVLKENNAIENGSLARQSIFRIDGKKPYMNKGWMEGSIREACMTRLAQLVGLAIKIQTMKDHRDYVVYVELGDLKDRFNDWNDGYTDVVNKYEHSDSIKSIMAGRAYVKLLKFAGLATAFNHVDGVLRVEEADWAKRFADYELDGVDTFFADTVLGDELEDAALFLMKNIHKMLTGGYKGTKFNKALPPVELIKRQQFTYSNIKQASKNPNTPTTKLNDDPKRVSRPRTGLDKAIAHLLATDRIYIVTKKPIGWRGGKLYGITDVFTSYLP